MSTKQRKDSSYAQDFIGGLDPTGVRTFENALGNEENHGRHKALGNAGGFASGAVIGSTIPAGLLGATALGLKKRNPILSKEFANMGKGSLEALNPRKMKKYVGSMKDFAKFKGKGSEVLRDAKDITESTKSINIKNPEHAVRTIRGNIGKTKDVVRKQGEMDDLGKQISRKYFDGQSPAEGGTRALSALSTAGSAAIAGGSGALAANMQYNQGQKTRERMNGTDPEPDLQKAAGLLKIAAEANKTKKVKTYLAKTYPDKVLGWVGDATWEEKKNVPLSKIKMARRPGGAREQDKVKNIAKAVEEKKPMEPVVLVQTPDGKYKIADGFHRTLGFEHAGRKTIHAWVGQVEEDKGPWDKDMHEAKLNVGKKASRYEPEGLLKTAFFGFGINVADLDKKGKYGVSLGFPYGIGFTRKFTEAPVKPMVGVGLTGPFVGASV